MFTDVHSCSLMYTCVHWHTLMFTDVHSWSLMYIFAHLWAVMYNYVHWCRFVFIYVPNRHSCLPIVPIMPLWSYYCAFFVYTSVHTQHLRIQVLNHALSRERLWQRYHTKNHLAFFQKLLWITSNIMKLLSEWRPELPLWQRYKVKNYTAFNHKFIWITSNIMKHLFKSQPENFLSCLLQVSLYMHRSAI